MKRFARMYLVKCQQEKRLYLVDSFYPFIVLKPTISGANASTNSVIKLFQLKTDTAMAAAVAAPAPNMVHPIAGQ